MSYSPSISPPQPASGRSALWSVIVVATALAGVLAGYWLKSGPDPLPVATAAMEEGCDLRQGGCRALLPGNAAVRFSITPHDIPLFQPLQLEVVVDGLAADAVEIDFAGVDMNMGPNHVRLSRSDSGRFTGEGILPACIRDRMTWQATVKLDTDAGLYAAVYRFDSFRNR